MSLTTLSPIFRSRPAQALSGSSFVSGEAATVGATLPKFQSAVWGVQTTDVNGSAAANVSLVGLGSWPITIGFHNIRNGNRTAAVIGNDVVEGRTSQVGRASTIHTQWQIVLSQVPPRFASPSDTSA